MHVTPFLYSLYPGVRDLNDLNRTVYIIFWLKVNKHARRAKLPKEALLPDYADDILDELEHQRQNLYEKADDCSE
jgi:hypothetical protein